MDNSIIKAVLFVTFLWYTIALFAISTTTGVSQFMFLELPQYLLHSLVMVFNGLLAGVGIATILWIKKTAAIEKLKTQKNSRGMTFSFGEVIGQRPSPKRSSDSAEALIPSDLLAWYLDYQNKYPVHSACFLAIAQTFRAYADIPASPVPGGHGGATLEQHSYNILREALSSRKSFVYDGHRDKKGKIIFPRIDGNYQFDNPEDPLVPLCAFAHDIGKIECYQVKKGMVVEVKANHDEEGGKLLTGIKEFWDMPMPDRNAMTICVTFYHHISAIPKNKVDDRSRALAEFTILVDKQTGKKEGEENMDKYFVYVEEEGVPPSPEQIAEQAAMCARYDQSLAEFETKVSSAGYSKKGNKGSIHDEEISVADAGADPFGATKPTPAKVVPSVVIAPHHAVNDIKQFGDENLPSESEMKLAYEAFSALVCKPGAFGINEASRIGFKGNGYLYLQERGMRTRIGKCSPWGDITNDTGGNVHPFTRAVLYRLFQGGNLYNQHNGLTYSPRVALFNVEGHGKGGKHTEMKCCLVFKASAFPSVANLADSPYPPTPIAPFKGESSAYGKKKTNADESAPIEAPQAEQTEEKVQVNEVNNPLPAINSVSNESVEDDIEYTGSNKFLLAAVKNIERIDAVKQNQAPKNISQVRNKPDEPIDIPILPAQTSAVTPTPVANIFEILKAAADKGDIDEYGGFEQENGAKMLALFPFSIIEKKFNVKYGDPIENSKWIEHETDQGNSKFFVIRLY